MAAGRLSLLYDRVLSASAREDPTEAHAAFSEILGLGTRRSPAAIPRRPPATVSIRRYGEVNRLNVLALAGGARQIAKFEDLSLEASLGLEAELTSLGLRVARKGPYAKRFDVTVTRGGWGSDLYEIFASRGDEALEVAEAESDRSSEGTRRVGRLLGYPPCCVEHFASAESSVAAEADGINEAALRSMMGLDDPIPWELNFLATGSPVGFLPCRASCPAALAFARRVLASVERLDAAIYTTTERSLRRPVLFFRYPLFFVLDGAPDESGARRVRFLDARANDDGTDIAEALGPWLEDEVGCVLAAGDAVSLEVGDEPSLEVRRGEDVVARWTLARPRVPLLLRFVG